MTGLAEAVADIHNLPARRPRAMDAVDGAVMQTSPGEVMTSRGVAPYQLLRVSVARGDEPAAACRNLGRYDDLEAAVRARVEDVLRQLAANDGWLVHAEHLIIGPGEEGPATVHHYISGVGADPADDRVPSPHNEPALRRWLLSAHSRPT